MDKRTRNKRVAQSYIALFCMLIVCTCCLVVSEKTVDKLITENEELKHLNNELINENVELFQHNKIMIEQIEKIEQESKNFAKSVIGQFEVTAYDLSVQSCGKYPSHPEYGITASGVDLEGKDWHEARAIAVDPKVIPIGSKVRIEFDKSNYMVYNGIYTAVDTGSAIKGNIIDLFMGDFNSTKANSKTINFGRVVAMVYAVK